MELGPVLFFILSHLRDVVFALALAGAALSFRLLLRGARPLPAASLAFLAVLAAVASPAASRPWALFSIPGALILAGSAAASAFSFPAPDSDPRSSGAERWPGFRDSPGFSYSGRRCR